MNKKIIIGVVVLIIIIGLFTLKMGKNNNSGKKVVLETSKGDITIQLYGDMPVTAGNFEKLVNQGFYNGVIFHRVINGFMIQGGDPTGTGMGGPDYKIKDEFTETNLDENNRGT